MIQSRTKSFHHHNSKDCDGKHARYAGHGVVDPRDRADLVFIHRIHNHGGERSFGDRHSEPENNHWWERRCPITASDRRHSEQNEAQDYNKRTVQMRTLDLTLPKDW